MENVGNMFESPTGRRIGKWAAFVLMALTLFLVVGAINGFKQFGYIGKGEANQNIITVSGKGEVVAIPDIVTLSFGVEEEAATVADAQTKATAKINAAVDFLRKNGIAEKDIKTIGYNIYPRYEYESRTATIYYPGNGKQILAAYVVSQMIEVKIRTTADAGKILAGVGELGVTNVSGLNFTNDKDDELKKEAREKAIADARADADRLARDLGVSIVRIVNFSESGNYPSPMMYKTMAADSAGNAAPEVPAGENTFVSNVTITYEIR